jgi:hypothetical protein
MVSVRFDRIEGKGKMDAQHFPGRIVANLEPIIGSLRESCLHEMSTGSLGGGRRSARKRASSDPRGYQEQITGYRCRDGMEHRLNCYWCQNCAAGGRASTRTADTESMIVIVAEIRKIALASDHRCAFSLRRPGASHQYSRPVFTGSSFGIVVRVGTPFIHVS